MMTETTTTTSSQITYVHTRNGHLSDTLQFVLTVHAVPFLEPREVKKLFRSYVLQRQVPKFYCQPHGMVFVKNEGDGVIFQEEPYCEDCIQVLIRGTLRCHACHEFSELVSIGLACPHCGLGDMDSPRCANCAMISVCKCGCGHVMCHRDTCSFICPGCLSDSGESRISNKCKSFCKSCQQDICWRCARDVACRNIDCNEFLSGLSTHGGCPFPGCVQQCTCCSQYICRTCLKNDGFCNECVDSFEKFRMPCAVCAALSQSNTPKFYNDTECTDCQQPLCCSQLCNFICTHCPKVYHKTCASKLGEICGCSGNLRAIPRNCAAM